MRLRHTMRGVRVRTTALALGAVLAALIVASIGLVVLQRQVLQGALDTRLQQRVADLTASIGNGANVADLTTATVGDDTIVQIVNSEGIVVASTANLDDEKLIQDQPGGATTKMFDVPEVEVADQSGSFRVAATTATSPAGDVFSVYAGGPDESVRESVRALTQGLLVATPMLLVLLGAVLWYVTGRALRPVDAIRERADGIGGGDLQQRVPTTGTGDEIDRLALTMNRMLDRLQASSERQQAFVADASHELRTPLAGIITQLEAARSVDAVASYRDAGRVSLTEAHRMRRLVEDLLVLARADRGGAPRSRRELVDLDDVVLDEARGHRSGTVALDTTRVSGGQIRADGDQVRRIVRNLVDNATSHARSLVAVSVEEDAGKVRLVVGDDGPGIPPGDRDRVFERFVRLDTARARLGGGAGLGLAITRTLVEGIDGTIAVGDSGLGGAELTVEFPAATS